MVGTGPGSDSGGNAERHCPWCGSPATTFVSRGYTGPTDETNQYFTCEGCGRTTFELVAKTAREMRLGRFKPGDFYQDRANRTRYQISRVLRVGTNEFLIYLKPLPPAEKRRVGATDDLEPPM
jgi:transposase-like protein